MRIVNLLVLSAIFLFIIGCSREENDINKHCTSNCTIIKGKFVTLNNEPVANVNISLNYQIGGMGGSYTRKIIDTNSDSNGNYNQNFYVKDDELGNNVQGYFEFKIDDSKLDVNKYIRTNNLIGNTTIIMGETFQINKRDTIIDNTFYIPKKVYIKVNLKNFNPQQNDDYFEVQTLYPFGAKIGNNSFLDSPYSTGFSGYGNFRAINQDTNLHVFVAEGEKNIIRIFRRKNGVNTSEDFMMFIPQNNNIQLSYNY